MDNLRDYIIFLPSSLQQPAYLVSSLSSRAASTLAILFAHVKQQPDVASIALLILLLFVSLQVLRLLYRTVMFWLFLGLRIALYAGAAALGLWLWTRGLDGALDDIQALAAYWNREYEHFQQRQSGGMPGWGNSAGAGAGQWPFGLGGAPGGRGRAKGR